MLKCNIHAELSKQWNSTLAEQRRNPKNCIVHSFAAWIRVKCNCTRRILSMCTFLWAKSQEQASKWILIIKYRCCVFFTFYVCVFLQFYQETERKRQDRKKKHKWIKTVQSDRQFVHHLSFTFYFSLFNRYGLYSLNDGKEKAKNSKNWRASCVLSTE